MSVTWPKSNCPGYNFWSKLDITPLDYRLFWGSVDFLPHSIVKRFQTERMEQMKMSETQTFLLNQILAFKIYPLGRECILSAL